jgi:translocation and assembly module TamA
MAGHSRLKACFAQESAHADSPRSGSVCEVMAYGRPALLRLQRLAAACCTAGLCLSAEALAQGRVPVEGAPASLSNELRRLLRNEPAPQSLFDARRQTERAAETIARLLESEGYYAAEVTPYAEGLDTFTYGVRVDHGPLFIYGSSAIDYIGSEPDEETRGRLNALLEPIMTGTPAAAQPVIDVGDRLVARLQRSGYADASAQPVDALADGRAHTLDLTFRLEPGARAAFGDLQVSGLDRTRLDFIEALTPWERGERFSSVELDEFRSRLTETGLFSTAAVKLAEGGETSPGGLTSRDVIVDVSERERRTISLGASASTSEGAGVDGEWELRNITGRGDSITVGAQAATLESRIETTYRRPNIGGRYSRDLSLTTGVISQQTDAYDLVGAGVEATLEEQLSRTVRASLGLEAAYASIDDQLTRAAGTGSRDVYILSGSATAEYTGVRDILDPQDGMRARVSVEPGITTGDTDITFTRLSLEASVYEQLWSDNLVGALRMRVGSVVGPPTVPPDRLFFAGGGGSVRGYEYQSLSPRDAAGELIGGRSLTEVTAELRWRTTERLGFVAFVDAGVAGPDTEPAFDDMRAGFGLGVRYYAGFGPLRADIAVPLDKREGDADVQVYISIGQAF